MDSRLTTAPTAQEYAGQGAAELEARAHELVLIAAAQGAEACLGTLADHLVTIKVERERARRGLGREPLAPPGVDAQR